MFAAIAFRISVPIAYWESRACLAACVGLCFEFVTEQKSAVLALVLNSPIKPRNHCNSF